MSDWVSVESQMPPEDEDVLLYWGEHVPFDIGHMLFGPNGIEWQRANDGMDTFDAEPTHWMRLPEAP
jgi:hypothetical protein